MALAVEQKSQVIGKYRIHKSDSGFARGAGCSPESAYFAVD